MVGWRLVHGSDYESILAIIGKRLAYLNKDPEGVRRFARDLSELHQISSTKMALISAAGPLYSRLSLDGDSRFERSVHHGEERVTSSYLLSSDFFVNGANMSREIRYLGMYDPLSPCHNPFARLGQV